MTLHIPTSLSNEKVKAFQAMYLKKYGEQLTFDKARDEALKLIQFVGLIIQDNPDFEVKNEALSDN